MGNCKECENGIGYEVFYTVQGGKMIEVDKGYGEMVCKRAVSDFCKQALKDFENTPHDREYFEDCRLCDALRFIGKIEEYLKKHILDGGSDAEPTP